MNTPTSMKLSSHRLVRRRRRGGRRILARTRTSLRGGWPRRRPDHHRAIRGWVDLGHGNGGGGHTGARGNRHSRNLRLQREFRWWFRIVQWLRSESGVWIRHAQFHCQLHAIHRGRADHPGGHRTGADILRWVRGDAHGVDRSRQPKRELACSRDEHCRYESWAGSTSEDLYLSLRVNSGSAWVTDY